MLFLLGQMFSQTLEDMIVALLVEKQITTVGDTKGDSQHDIALYSINKRRTLAKDKGRWKVIITRKWVMTWNCRIQFSSQ